MINRILGTIVFVALIAALIWRFFLMPKPPETDVKPFQDSIKVLKHYNDSIDHQNDLLIFQADSLTKLKQNTKILYREKYVFIDNASFYELDSIIKRAIRQYDQSRLLHIYRNEDLSDTTYSGLRVR